MAAFTFQPMDEESAREILAWRYAGLYAVYDPGTGDPDAALRTFLDPANAYFAVRDGDGALVAYWCFGPDARVPGGDYAGEALDVGGGVRPELTGRGRGLPLLEAALGFARERFHPPAFRVTVAEWNARALRACERAGFVVEQSFANPEGTRFAVLRRPG
ncbi:MAG TPA: GNAT family protein [Longimicrobium sp.]|jgi:GNAT superfamily N-acetyltransferase